MSVDWQQLSPLAFESFSRELMGEHLHAQIEAFAPGPDGGVDLRTHDGKTVIQCKRYTSDKSKLFNKLLEEARKDRVKNAERYILLTSLHLTPNDKDKIREIISAIQTTEDILGADDLEGLLANYPKVRSLYPQLWLGDESRLLELIGGVVNRGIDEMSKEEFRQIVETMKYVARPPLADEAYERLKEHHALIITGKPGIGKTTLARYLIWNIIQTAGYEFVFISSHIDSAFQKFDNKKKQIFFYDDFLGANFIKLGLEKNEDKRISSFINKVKNSKNKLAVFTTREFIFQQATTKYENLREHEENIKRIVLEIGDSDYTYKAEILYNHFWRNCIPYNLVQTLFYDTSGNKWGENCHLAKILQHTSFNPRIIAAALSTQRGSINENTFAQFILDQLNHPHSLYEILFYNQLSVLHRKFLLILGSFENYISLERLNHATQALYEEGSSSPEETFDNSLKILIGDFLTSSVVGYSEKFVMINFVNPGIRDFIISRYLKNHSSLIYVIGIAKYPEQLCNILHIVDEFDISPRERTLREIAIKGRLLIEEAIQLEETNDTHVRLGAILSDLDKSSNYDLLKLLIETESRGGFQYIDSDNLDSYISLLYLFETDNSVNIDKSAFIHSVLENINDTTAFNIFDELDSLKKEALQESETSTAAEVWIENYFQFLSDLSEISELEEEKYYIQNLHQAYPEGIAGICFGAFIDDIDNLIARKEEEREESESSRYEDYDKDWYYSSYRNHAEQGYRGKNTSSECTIPRHFSIFETLDTQ